MRLDKQDQLTAVDRFLRDAWTATRDASGDAGFERIRAALGHPDGDVLEETVRLELGDEGAKELLRDLRPYL